MRQSRPGDLPLTEEAHLSDLTTAFFVFVSLPFIAISEMEVSLVMLPLDLLSELLVLLTLMLAQAQESGSPSCRVTHTDLSVHETTLILRHSVHSPFERDLAEVAQGGHSQKSKIPPVPSFLPPLWSPVHQQSALSKVLGEIVSPLTSLHSELESSLSNSSRHTPPSVSTLCSSLMRSVELAQPLRSLPLRVFYSELTGPGAGDTKMSDDLLASSLLFSLHRAQVCPTSLPWSCLPCQTTPSALDHGAIVGIVNLCEELSIKSISQEKQLAAVSLLLLTINSSSSTTLDSIGDWLLAKLFRIFE
jgi:hypothetical protein